MDITCEGVHRMINNWSKFKKIEEKLLMIFKLSCLPETGP